MGYFTKDKAPTITFQELHERIQAASIVGINADIARLAPPAPEAPAAATAETPAHRPARWDDYVGQRRVRRRLEVAVASALARGERAEHIMLFSGPGQGKTTLANLIAAELDRPLVLLTKPPTSDEFRRACERASEGVLFCDEVHCWNDALQHQLMELTESGTLDTKFGAQHFPDLTVIAATTEPLKLLAPLVDRFGCKVTLDPYTDDDMLAIAQGMVARCWPDGYEPLDEATCAVLATASAGVPRDMRSLIFAGRDLALANQEVSAAEILLLCDTDPDGCTRAHLDMLACLADSNNGTAGLAMLSDALRVAPAMMRRTERLLLDRHYIALTPSGRAITLSGQARLKAGSIRDFAA